MSRLTLTAKEQKRKKEQNTKIAITIVILVAIATLAIWYVFAQDAIKQKEGIIDLNTIAKKSGEIAVKKSGENMVKMTSSEKYSSVEQNPIVTMEMANGEIVKIELYPQVAPTTVENFISLIKKGFYDGLTFHRVMPEFMAQGGDPSGDGTGGPGYSIYGEFSENGFANDLKHDIGVISMARAEDPNSAGSQFFIVTNEQSYLSLDGKYAGFGKVIEGMDAVYEIVNSETVRKEYSKNIQDLINEGGQISSMEMYYQYLNETTEMTRPKNPPVIKKMTVDTFGTEYNEPEKM